MKTPEQQEVARAYGERIFKAIDRASFSKAPITLRRAHLLRLRRLVWAKARDDTLTHTDYDGRRLVTLLFGVIQGRLAAMNVKIKQAKEPT